MCASGEGTMLAGLTTLMAIHELAGPLHLNEDAAVRSKGCRCCGSHRSPCSRPDKALTVMQKPQVPRKTRSIAPGRQGGSTLIAYDHMAGAEDVATVGARSFRGFVAGFDHRSAISLGVGEPLSPVMRPEIECHVVRTAWKARRTDRECAPLLRGLGQPQSVQGLLRGNPVLRPSA